MDLVAVGKVCFGSTATDLIVGNSQTQDASAVEQRIEEMQERIDKARAALVSLMDQISAMSKDVAEANRDLHETIKRLRDELYKVQEYIRAQMEEQVTNHVDDDLDDEFADLEEEFKNYKREVHDDPEEYEEQDVEDVDENPDIVLLFRKIAAKTHPDKTDDPELHSLFVAAKTCRQNRDLKGLQDIWAIVCGDTTSVLSKLLEQLASLKQELYHVSQQLESLQNSAESEILHFYKHDRLLLISATRDQLLKRERDLREQVSMLKRLSNYPEAKKLTPLFDF